jgi:hypothetical protein
LEGYANRRPDNSSHDQPEAGPTSTLPWTDPFRFNTLRQRRYVGLSPNLEQLFTQLIADLLRVVEKEQRERLALIRSTH